MKEQFNKIHLIGIGGISMSAIAEYLKHLGYIVTGSDIAKNMQTAHLEKLGINIFYNHDKLNVTKDIDLVVYNSAIAFDNPELLSAKAQNINTVKREALLGEIVNSFKRSIAISGMHGKTTATGMLSHICLDALLCPTIFIGGVLPKINSNVYIGNSDLCIAEACEYKRSFLALSPYISIILNIDLDHLDYYKDIEDIKSSYLEFANNTSENGFVMACGDDENIMQLDIKRKTYYFGLNNGDFLAKNIKSFNGKNSFDIYFNQEKIGHISLNVLGRHNIYNALATFAVGYLLNLNTDEMEKSILGFNGVERRFFKMDSDFTNVVNDYAHHPKEINMLIESAKQLNYEHIYMVFQPHTFTRTKSLYPDFIKSLSDIDMLVLVPIYAARENPLKGISSIQLCRDINLAGQLCFYADNFNDAEKIIKTVSTKNDLVLVVGAGDIIELCKKLET